MNNQLRVNYLLYGEDCILLAVDGLLGEQVQGDPLVPLGVDDSVLALPRDVWRGLASEPDVVADRLALLDLDVVHARVVDKRFY